MKYNQHIVIATGLSSKVREELSLWEDVEAFATPALRLTHIDNGHFELTISFGLTDDDYCTAFSRDEEDESPGHYWLIWDESTAEALKRRGSYALMFKGGEFQMFPFDAKHEVTTLKTSGLLSI